MWENDDAYRRAIQTANNHRKRAAEGRKLLSEGKLLDQMTTPIIGLSDNDTILRRKSYLTELKDKTKNELSNMLEGIQNMIEHRLTTPDVGTSELEWQALAIKDMLENRN